MVAVAAPPQHPATGDIVEVSSRRVGEAPRLGEILAVLAEGGSLHYRVLWEDGHESILYPGSDSRVLHMRHQATTRRH